MNLAELLGLSGDSTSAGADGDPVPPANDSERELAAIWQDVLGHDEPPGVEDDFFLIGGDSLHATELLVEIEEAFGVRLPATLFVTEPTVRAMAGVLRAPRAEDEAVSIVPIRGEGSRPPLHCLLRGGSVVIARHFARALGPDQPVFGLWSPTMHSTRDAAGSVEEIAAGCVRAVQQVQPEGPYFLFGHSLGGAVVYETAQQLAAQGHPIGLVVLADSPHPTIAHREWKRRHSARYRAKKLLSRRGPEIVAWRVRQLLGRNPEKPVEYVPGTDVPLDWSAAMERERSYAPRPAPGPVLILGTRVYRRVCGSPDLGWAPLLRRGWEAYEVPGNHNSMIGEPHVHVLAARMAERLRRAQDEGGATAAAG
jgi:thioesterase domain-containing protein/acyl carrier protein